MDRETKLIHLEDYLLSRFLSEDQPPNVQDTIEQIIEEYIDEIESSGSRIPGHHKAADVVEQEIGEEFKLSDESPPYSDSLRNDLHFGSSHGRSFNNLNPLVDQANETGAFWDNGQKPMNGIYNYNSDFNYKFGRMLRSKKKHNLIPMKYSEIQDNEDGEKIIPLWNGYNVSPYRVKPGEILHWDVTNNYFVEEGTF